MVTLIPYSIFVLPVHLAKISFFWGEIYLWVNISILGIPLWASRVLYKILGISGKNQYRFTALLAQNSNFIRPGTLFCCLGTIRWPCHIWSGMLEIFVNSNKNVLWEYKKVWTAGEKWILVTEHCNICVLLSRDIMVAQYVFCKKKILWTFFLKIEFVKLVY